MNLKKENCKMLHTRYEEGEAQVFEPMKKGRRSYQELEVLNSQRKKAKVQQARQRKQERRNQE